MKELDEYIAQKRAEKQNDSIILEQLVAVGWDKQLVLQRLAGDSVPKPGTAPTPPTPSQTGGQGQPIQVENVQYNVQVGKVRSKIGFAAFIMSLFALGIAGTLLLLLLTIRQKLVTSGADASLEFGASIVFAIALLVPMGPIFWYARKRLHHNIEENPASVDDLFFKKTIRFHLVLGIITAAIWIMVAVYNILAKLFLDDQELTAGAVVDSIIFAFIFSGVGLFFLKYQNMTKR